MRGAESLGPNPPDLQLSGEAHSIDQLLRLTDEPGRLGKLTFRCHLWDDRDHLEVQVSRRRTPHLDQALLHQSLDPGLQLLQDLGGPLSGPLTLLLPLVLQFSLLFSLLQEGQLTAGLTKALLQTPTPDCLPPSVSRNQKFCWTSGPWPDHISSLLNLKQLYFYLQQLHFFCGLNQLGLQL